MKNIMHELYFGSSLRFIFEGFLEMSIAIFINLLNIEWTYEISFSVLYNNLFTCSMAIILIALPLYIWFYYNANIARLDDEHFQQRFGSLYGGMNLKENHKFMKRKVSIVFPLAFVLRRIAFVAAIVFLARWPVF